MDPWMGFWCGTLVGMAVMGFIWWCFKPGDPDNNGGG